MDSSSGNWEASPQVLRVLRWTEGRPWEGAESGSTQVAFGLHPAMTVDGDVAYLAVATSQMQVDDVATQALMARYYRRLAAGDDRVEAMRKVQLAMLRGGLKPPGDDGATWQHPRFWASFLVSGAAGPLKATRK